MLKIKAEIPLYSGDSKILYALSVIGAIFLIVSSVVLAITDAVAIPVFIVFLVMKLIGVIEWGWVYVCMPMIILAVSIFVEIILAVIMMFLRRDF